MLKVSKVPIISILALVGVAYFFLSTPRRASGPERSEVEYQNFDYQEREVNLALAHCTELECWLKILKYPYLFYAQSAQAKAILEKLYKNRDQLSRGQAERVIVSLGFFEGQWLEGEVPKLLNSSVWRESALMALSQRRGSGRSKIFRQYIERSGGREHVSHDLSFLMAQHQLSFNGLEKKSARENILALFKTATDQQLEERAFHFLVEKIPNFNAFKLALRTKLHAEKFRLQEHQAYLAAILSHLAKYDVLWLQQHFVELLNYLEKPWIRSQLIGSLGDYCFENGREIFETIKDDQEFVNKVLRDFQVNNFHFADIESRYFSKCRSPRGD